VTEFPIVPNGIPKRPTLSNADTPPSPRQ
jgi:hypothetical protein